MTKTQQFYNYIRLLIVVFCCSASLAYSDPPTSENVDTYAGLCKIGNSDRYELEAKVSAPLALIARRILAGEAKLSAGAITDNFPNIKDENNRLIALQSYQDCMYRYVERFHITSEKNEDGKRAISTSPISPSVPTERRREIVFLANQLEDFKEKMKKVIETIPNEYYDTRMSIKKKPREDQRIVGIDNYKRYRAFQTATGTLDFSGMTNNDISLLCDTFQAEAKGYFSFQREYSRVFNIQQYRISKEVSRICAAANRGR